MRKVLAVLAIALFMGAIGAPALAATTGVQVQIALTEEEPKKKEKEKKSDAKSEKSSDCSKSCDKKKSKEEKGKS